MTEVPSTQVWGDWGSTRLRLFLMQDGAVIDRAQGPGIGGLANPAAALTIALAPWRTAQALSIVVLCGMAGSRNGVVEVAYAPCPADAAAWAGHARRLDLDGLPLTIAPGLACTRADGAADVMRGEETQVFGALALHPDLARGRRRLVLPGTHSKWVDLQDGAVQGFGTWFTGELHALLTTQSSLATADPRPEGEEQGFVDGLARAGTGLLGTLFEARAAQLRQGRSGGWARGFLSGLLIGTELAEALAPGDDAPTLIGGAALCARYHAAFAARGLAPAVLDGDDCARAGLGVLTRLETPHG